MCNDLIGAAVFDQSGGNRRKQRRDGNIHGIQGSYQFFTVSVRNMDEGGPKPRRDCFGEAGEIDHLLWREGSDGRHGGSLQQIVDAVFYHQQILFFCCTGNHFSCHDRHDMGSGVLVIGNDIEPLYFFILHRVTDPFFRHLIIQALNRQQVDAKQFGCRFDAGKSQRFRPDPVPRLKQCAERRCQGILSARCRNNVRCVRIKPRFFHP